MTILIGNDFAEAHRCLEIRFSSDPQDSLDAILILFGWMLHGSQLQDNEFYKPSSSFFVRDHMWPTDTCDLEDIVLTNEGESSSSNKVIQTVPEKERSKSLQNSMSSNGPRERVLGINWDFSSDEFFFKVDLPDTPTTKRGILAVTNLLYNSLGFVSPVVPLAKLIYSESCRDKLGWHEVIKKPYLKIWQAWIIGLVHLWHLKIPQCYKPKCDNKTRCNYIYFQMHLT